LSLTRTIADRARTRSGNYRLQLQVYHPARATESAMRSSWRDGYNAMKHDEMLMYPDEYRVMFEIEDNYWWYRGVRALLKRLLDRYAPRIPRVRRFWTSVAAPARTCNCCNRTGLPSALTFPSKRSRFAARGAYPVTARS